MSGRRGLSSQGRCAAASPSGTRSPPRVRAGLAGRAGVPSHDRRPALAGPRRSRPSRPSRRSRRSRSWPGRVRAPRSRLALSLAGVSLAPRGPSPRKARVVLRPAVVRAPEPNDRPAVPRGPSVGDGRAVRRVPSLAAGRAVRRAASPPRAVVSSRPRSGDDVRLVRRGLSVGGVRGARREPSPAAPSRPASSRPVPAWRAARLVRVSCPARLVRVSCPARPVRVSCPARLVRVSCPARPDPGRPRP